MYSTEGGMDIEEVAHNTPEKYLKSGFIQVVDYKVFKLVKLLLT
jgi:succinyl-CoA synthetase beta subunit